VTLFLPLLAAWMFCGNHLNTQEHFMRQNNFANNTNFVNWRTSQDLASSPTKVPRKWGSGPWQTSISCRRSCNTLSQFVAITLEIRNSPVNEPLKFTDTLLLLHIKHKYKCCYMMYIKVYAQFSEWLPWNGFRRQSFVLWLTQQNTSVYIFPLHSSSLEYLVHLSHHLVCQSGR